jgi:spoIIIJ-associated protein
MRSIESDGDTIDHAIEKALQVLQVGRERVEVEILEDAARGLLGFGGKKARIRATVRPPLVSRETILESPPAGPDHKGASLSPGDAATRRAEEVLGGILTRMGTTGEVRARRSDEGDIIVEVSGEGSGVVIGRRGQTLDALEHLLNRIVSRDAEGEMSHITLDAENYRSRRREYLGELAARLADKAKQTGRMVTLNPLSPRDRRIVHLALQGDPEVSTRSIGEGHFRKLCIMPQSGPRSRA